jgi:hypothetical protein
MKCSFLLSVFFLPLLIACATQGERPPLWVTNREAAYPDRDWLCFVESAGDRNTAEAAALSALSQIFRVDIQSVTGTNQTLVSQIQKNSGKSVSQSEEFRRFAQDITLVSSASGLIGLERDFWTAKNGSVIYAIVRMNRGECAVRYKALIAQNEKFISLLTKGAEELNGTFDACANLSFAASVAELTDNYCAVLSVLEKGAIPPPAYGNAAAIKLLLREAAREIVIVVKVSGDIDSRIEKAFSAFFTKQGFRTAEPSTERPYLLNAVFRVEDVPQQDQSFVYARFVLNAALAGKDGAEVLSYSANDRVGHVSPQEARQRAIRRAEEAITETGFAKEFDGWFSSLL